LNLAPSNDGVVIRLNLPPMTEERRKDLSKVVTRMAEEARISIRHSRQKALDAVKDLAKNSQATEDQVKSFEKKLQEKVDKYNMDIEMSSKTKEHDILTV
jgi:ribosome recycling factor